MASLSLPKVPVNEASVPTTGRRLAFAKRLTGGQHPLTARVLMNRVWMHHFGRGIVDSPGDFGVLGDRPSHPALLDWLADRDIPSVVALTKVDKLKPMRRKARLAAMKRELTAPTAAVITTSSLKGDGVDDMWRQIYQMIGR